MGKDRVRYEIGLGSMSDVNKGVNDGNLVITDTTKLVQLISKADDVSQKRIIEHDGQYCVESETTGRSFGCYPTEDEAKDRLDQIERFSEEKKAEEESDLDATFRAYHETVNMSESELTDWAETECSKLASLNRGPITRNKRLLSRIKADWTEADIKAAKRTIAFVSRMSGIPKGEPAKEGCPSKRDISLKNWAFDPDKSRKALEDDPTTKRDLEIVNEVMNRDITLVIDQEHSIAKADEKEKQFILGIVLEPNDGEDGSPLDPDAQQDVYSAEWIEQQAHDFMASYRRIGLMHEIVLPTDAVQILESYIAPANFEMELASGGTYRVRKGTWLLGVKVLDADLWKSIKSGEFTGFSIEGFAQKTKERIAKALSAKTICLYHADMDGKMSAAIVVKALSPDQVDCREINYGIELPWEDIAAADSLVIVDFCPQPFDEMVCIHDVCEAMDTHLTWIDHHETAIDAYAKYDIEISGLQIIGEGEPGEDGDWNPADLRAGCDLTWKYFFPEKEEPLAPWLIGRWDVWDHKADEDVRAFHFGMEAYESANPDGGLLQSSLSWVSKESDCNEVLVHGRAIYGYLVKGYESSIKSMTFEVELDGLNCIAINTSEKGSIQFESVEGQYDAAIAFKWSPKAGWLIGMYAMKKGVNVAEVCKAHGGGGHRGAGGFSTSELPFALPLE